MQFRGGRRPPGDGRGAAGRSIVARRSAAARCAGATIFLAGLAAYAGSFSGPFLFDDVPSILDNPTIRHLGRLREVLAPPSAGGVTVGGRPLVNLSLALDYAISGNRVWSYHAFNLAIHLLAGLTLFGVLHRIGQGRAGRLGPPSPTGGPGRAALPRSHGATFFAFAVALWWTVHPLQTESVTYVIQRAESMMGLFYLLTLYCFLRYAEESDDSEVAVDLRATGDEPAAPPAVARRSTATPWAVLSVIACLAGMAAKEVMVSAPVIVLLCDRAFVAGSFRRAWNERRRFYAALASTWLLLAWLVIRTGGNRGGSTGLGTPVPWLTYAASQFPAIIHYLRLVFWPHPLVFYYPVRWPSAHAAAPAAVLVAILVTAGCHAFVRNRAIGFFAAWFFAVLAPTSLIPGAGQTWAEHRMYLALAPLLAAVILIGAALVRAWPPAAGSGTRQRFVLSSASGLALAGVLAIGTALTWATAQRNQTYRTELGLWQDTAAHTTGNALAECQIGVVYTKRGDQGAARAHFEKALRIRPDDPDALVDMGNVERADGRGSVARAYYERAVQLRPDFPEAILDLAAASRDQGRAAEAIALSEKAARLRPLSGEAQDSLALSLVEGGRHVEAIARYRRALELKPDDAPSLADTHEGLALALGQSGRLNAAIREHHEALRLNPAYAEADYNLGNLLAAAGRLPEAVASYRAALQARPDLTAAEANLGSALLAEGHAAEAIVCFRDALRRQPDNADARHNLELAQRMSEGTGP